MSESNHNNTPEDLHSVRLARLETIVEGLSRNLTSLSNSVESYISASGKTNWNVLFAAVGAGVGVVLWVINSTITPLDSRVLLIEKDIQEVNEFVKNTANTRFTKSEGEILKSDLNQYKLDRAKEIGYRNAVIDRLREQIECLRNP
jgi:hypothetical protein